MIKIIRFHVYRRLLKDAKKDLEFCKNHPHFLDGLCILLVKRYCGNPFISDDIQEYPELMAHCPYKKYDRKKYWWSISRIGPDSTKRIEVLEEILKNKRNC